VKVRAVPDNASALLVAAVRDAGKVLVLEAHVQDDVTLEAAIQEVLDCAQAALDMETSFVLSVSAPDSDRIHAYRLLVTEAHRLGIDAPVLLGAYAPPGDPFISPAIALGSLLRRNRRRRDGVGRGRQRRTRVQHFAGSGRAAFKTDYVACPSCGRTLFDLQETERIKLQTSHLVGVKLAIMGCIVNGPGEMADADFGTSAGRRGRSTSTLARNVLSMACLPRRQTVVWWN
jgi:4-hydroxy-3-methylbut-2-en-1-yl diphosphate synthase IspG/GcpE